MLSNAYLFQGKDGAYRDLSSLHGTYKKVQQTQKAIEFVADFCMTNQLKKIIWVFDKPVSNSGRMKTWLTDFASTKGLDWDVFLENNPDKIIAESEYIAITSDAWILDRVQSWYNLIDYLIVKDYPALIIS